MKLTVDREDLKPEHKNRNCSQIGFEHLNDAAQEAVRAVGKGTFEEDDRRSYNAVYAPAP